MNNSLRLQIRKALDHAHTALEFCDDPATEARISSAIAVLDQALLAPATPATRVHQPPLTDLAHLDSRSQASHGVVGCGLRR
jgi:hypothetical protein